MRTKRGFTLIELLVVIAIIGILASVVLASLGSARIKSRDARRIADVKQLQTALTLYSSDNSEGYPTSTVSLAPTYIPSIPMDPSATTTPYLYAGLADIADDPYCNGFHLGADLEDNNNTAADNDANLDSTSVSVPKCQNGGAGFDGSADGIYDVRP